MSNQIKSANGGARGTVTNVPVSGDIGRAGGRPTMKDVASRAGVALKTVSRVVNREPGVTPETTKRVLGAIEDLGFRRNESARLLRTGHTATLGYIADTWTDPDHAAVYRGLEQVAREHGYLLYSGSTDSDAEREEQLALAMCARRVDGLIISPTPGSHDYLVSAIAHLVTLGHSKIGFLGEAAGYRSRTLRAEYAEAMAATGLAVDPAWLALDAAGLAYADVTAVFCADRERTRAALRALGPRSVAVVGFGDFELADLLSPPVTVVSYDAELIGRTAGELLLRRMAGDQAPPRRIEVPVRLIAR